MHKLSRLTHTQKSTETQPPTSTYIYTYTFVNTNASSTNHSACIRITTTHTQFPFVIVVCCNNLSQKRYVMSFGDRIYLKMSPMKFSQSQIFKSYSYWTQKIIVFLHFSSSDNLPHTGTHTDIHTHPCETPSHHLFDFVAQGQLLWEWMTCAIEQFIIQYSDRDREERVKNPD